MKKIDKKQEKKLKRKDVLKNIEQRNTNLTEEDVFEVVSFAFFLDNLLGQVRDYIIMLGEASMEADKKPAKTKKKTTVVSKKGGKPSKIEKPAKKVVKAVKKATKTAKKASKPVVKQVKKAKKVATPVKKIAKKQIKSTKKGK